MNIGDQGGTHRNQFEVRPVNHSGYELLLDNLGAYQSGEIELDEFLAALEAVANHVVDYLEEFEELGPEDGVDPNDPLYLQVRSAFEEYLNSLEALPDQLDNPADCLEKLESSLKRLAEGQKALLAADSGSGKSACPYCSHLNAKGSRKCRRCSAILPEVGDEVIDSTVSVKELGPG